MFRIVKEIILNKRSYFRGVVIAKKEVRAIKNSSYDSGLLADTLLVSHSLEKGMGIKNVKKDYGKENASKLLGYLVKLNERGLCDLYAYKEGVAVLAAYIKYKEAIGEDVGLIKLRAEKLGESPITNVGFKTLLKADLMCGMNIDFEKFIGSRHSVRFMSDAPISNDEMLKAIRLSEYAPSACNRQPCKVYYTLEKRKNFDIAQIVPGNRGFSEDIPYYCIISVDRNMFKGEEMFQWYINGGIFVSYYVLGLHSLGIGSCIFQWPQFNDNEKRLREMISAPDNEAIIAIIGFGKYPEETKCICAQRKPPSEVASVF